MTAMTSVGAATAADYASLRMVQLRQAQGRQAGSSLESRKHSPGLPQCQAAGLWKEGRVGTTIAGRLPGRQASGAGAQADLPGLSPSQGREVSKPQARGSQGKGSDIEKQAGEKQRHVPQYRRLPKALVGRQGSRL